MWCAPSVAPLAGDVSAKNILKLSKGTMYMSPGFCYVAVKMTLKSCLSNFSHKQNVPRTTIRRLQVNYLRESKL